MNRCYTEVRFFKWREDETSVSLRNRSGSYGGGSEVLIVKVKDGNDNDESQFYAHGGDNRRNGEFSLRDRPQRPTDSNCHRGGVKR